MDDFKRPVKKQPVVGSRPVQRFANDMTVPKQRPVQKPATLQRTVPQRTFMQPVPKKPPVMPHSQPQSAPTRPVLKQHPVQPQRTAAVRPALNERTLAQQSAPKPPVAQTDNPAKTKEPEKVNFFKKYKKTLTVITAVLAIIAGICALLYYITPVVSINNEKMVNLGVEFKLQQYQIAKLKGGGVSVEIQHFTNGTCPENLKCFKSDKAVQYIISVNGQKYATGSLDKITGGGDYRIETVSTDYKSYANIKITKS